MSFGTIFGTLFWDYIMILWDENYVSKLLIGPKQVFFSVINHNKFSSQDNTKRTWTSLMWKKSCTTGLESRDTWTIWKSCQADWAFGALNPGLGSILELDYRLSTGFYYFEMEEWKRPDTYVYIWSKKKDKENKSQVLTHYTNSIWGSFCLFSRACVQQCVMLWKQPFWSQKQRCLRWPPWPPPGGRPQSPGARLRIPCGATQLGQMAKNPPK